MLGRFPDLRLIFFPSQNIFQWNIKINNIYHSCGDSSGFKPESLLFLIIEHPTNVKIQNASDNTGQAMLSGNTADLSSYDGGELVVQTPFAGFALLYVGNSTPDGGTAAPTSKTGWYLIEV